MPRRKKSETQDIFSIVCLKVLGIDPASARAESLRGRILDRAGSLTEATLSEIMSRPDLTILTAQDLTSSLSNTKLLESRLKDFLK